MSIWKKLLALFIKYDNSISGLSATNVQDAIDELSTSGGITNHDDLSNIHIAGTSIDYGHIDDEIYVNNFGYNNYYVNSQATISSPDGSIWRPYQSLQACMTAIGAPASTSDARRKITIHIAAGEYDESVTIPKQRLITFLCYGTVVIGDGAADDLYNSTTPRNLTITNTATGEPANAPSRPGFSVIGIGGETSSTHSAYNFGNLIISGDLQFQHIDGNTTTHETYLHSMKVQGNVTRNSFEAGSIHNIQIERCFFDNAFTLSNANINVCRSTEFDGLITCNSVGRFFECEIDGGITAVTVNNFYPPNGFINCDVGGGTWNITDTSDVPIDTITLKEIIDNNVTVTNGYTIIDKILNAPYNTTETIVGEWNGVTLYQKIISGITQTFLNTNGSTVAHGISGLSLVVKQNGRWNDGTDQYTFPNITSGNNNNDIYINATNIVSVSSNNTWGTITNGYFILEYTKT